MRAVNLIPSDDRASGRLGGIGTGRSQGAAYGVLALLAGLALLALVYGLARRQVSSRQSQLAAVEAKTNSVKRSSAALSSYTTFLGLREQRVQAVDALVDARFDWAHALHELGRVLPSGASVTTLNGTVGATATGAGASAAAPAPSAAPAAAGASGSGSSASAAPAVTSATPPGSIPTITLGGCATSQAKVALTLQRLRLIDGVGKVSLQSSVKSTGTAAASTGSCAGGPTFSAQITFEALPSSPTSGKSATELTSTGAAR